MRIILLGILMLLMLHKNSITKLQRSANIVKKTLVPAFIHQEYNKVDGFLDGCLSSMTFLGYVGLAPAFKNTDSFPICPTHFLRSHSFQRNRSHFWKLLLKYIWLLVLRESLQSCFHSIGAKSVTRVTFKWKFWQHLLLIKSSDIHIGWITHQCNVTIGDK